VAPLTLRSTSLPPRCTDGTAATPRASSWCTDGALPLGLLLSSLAAADAVAWRAKSTRRRRRKKSSLHGRGALASAAASWA
jgi:hypothetical protein